MTVLIINFVSRVNYYEAERLVQPSDRSAWPTLLSRMYLF